MEIEGLYRAHGEAMLRYLRRNFGACAAPEDLLHETFIHALTRRDECLAAQSPRAFLFGIARHVGLTAARRMKGRAAWPLPDVPAKQDAEDPSLEAMRAAIATLPEQLRETLAFRFARGIVL